MSEKNTFAIGEGGVGFKCVEGGRGLHTLGSTGKEKRSENDKKGFEDSGRTKLKGSNWTR